MANKPVVQSKTLLQGMSDIQFLMERMGSEVEELGHVKPETEVAMSGLLLSHESKVDRCAQFIRYAESEIDFLKNEIALIQSLVKRKEEMIKRMHWAVKSTCEIADTRFLDGATGHSFRLQDYVSVKVDNEDEIPMEWFDIEVVKKLRKRELKEHLVQGHSVPGVSLEKTTHVIVK